MVNESELYELARSIKLPSTQKDCPLEVVPRRCKPSQAEQDLHAQKVQQRKAQLDAFKQAQANLEMDCRPTQPRLLPQVKPVSAEHVAAVRARREQHEQLRLQQIMLDVASKEHRPKSTKKYTDHQEAIKQRKAELCRRRLEYKRITTAKNELDLKEHKAQLRLKDLAAAEKIKYEEKKNINKMKEMEVSKKRSKTENERNEKTRSELLIKEIRTRQNLDIEIKPELKKAYISNHKSMSQTKEITAKFREDVYSSFCQRDFIDLQDMWSTDNLKSLSPDTRAKYEREFINYCKSLKSIQDIKLS